MVAITIPWARTEEAIATGAGEAIATGGAEAGSAVLNEGMALMASNIGALAGTASTAVLTNVALPAVAAASWNPSNGSVAQN